jgi:hypothetical protein
MTKFEILSFRSLFRICIVEFDWIIPQISKPGVQASFISYPDSLPLYLIRRLPDDRFARRVLLPTFLVFLVKAVLPVRIDLIALIAIT